MRLVRPLAKNMLMSRGKKKNKENKTNKLNNRGNPKTYLQYKA